MPRIWPRELLSARDAQAAATMLAENGATAHELMAWFGWRSLKEAERYTQAADQKKLAVNVVRLFGRAKDAT